MPNLQSIDSRELVNANRNVDVHALHTALQSAASPVLLDVREYPEFAGGRIAQAMWIPWDELMIRTNRLDHQQPIYVICRDGRRSALIRFRLKALGFADVRNVVGGMKAWQDAGYPVERLAGAPWSLERQVRFMSGLVVAACLLIGETAMHPLIWVATTLACGLALSAMTDNCELGLLLVRLPWNRPRSGART